MADAPTPSKSYRAEHRRLALEHTNHVPDRDVTPLSKLSDEQFASRWNMQMLAKPIPSDAAHTARHAQPIPTHSAVDLWLLRRSFKTRYITKLCATRELVVRGTQCLRMLVAPAP